MEQFFENIYGVIIQPGVAMRRIAVQKPVVQALVVFALSVLIPTGTFYLAFETDNFGNMLLVIILALTMGGLVVWFSVAAILSMIAEFFGGSGSAKGLFVAMGFAQTPRILATPFFVLARLFPGSVFSSAANFVFMITFFWIMVLDVIAIKQAHDFGSAKAVLVFVIPLLVVVLAVLALMFYAGTAVLSDWICL